jgi:hypothetical protein
MKHFEKNTMRLHTVMVHAELSSNSTSKDPAIRYASVSSKCQRATLLHLAILFEFKQKQGQQKQEKQGQSPIYLASLILWPLNLSDISSIPA